MAADNAKPLAGKRIVVTRAREQAAEFVAQLEALGAQVVLSPSVQYEDPEDFTQLDRAIGDLESFDWILFTSQNTVSFFARRCRALGIAIPQTTKIAALAPKTAEAAKREGFRVDNPQVGARDNKGREFEGQKVLYPGSNLAMLEIADDLRSSGAEVTQVVAYRTVAPKPSTAHNGEKPAPEPVDVITFFSPSAFHNFNWIEAIELYGVSPQTPLAAIGPTTAAAIRKEGHLPIEAAEPTAESLAAAICDYFSERTRIEGGQS